MNDGSPFILDQPIPAWQAAGHDLHSLVADPEFVEPFNDDFRLKSHSPAIQLGFHPIDLNRFGP